jgi:hypothetical protein
MTDIEHVQGSTAGGLQHLLDTHRSSLYSYALVLDRPLPFYSLMSLTPWELHVEHQVGLGAHQVLISLHSKCIAWQLLASHAFLPSSQATMGVCKVSSASCHVPVQPASFLH